MASYNQFNASPGQNNFAYTNSSVENKGLFNRILRGLSSYGMNYDDMIVRNQVGIGINEDPYAARGNSMYDFFSQRAVASVLNRKSIPYLDKAYGDKRRILREYSIKDEIEPDDIDITYSKKLIDSGDPYALKTFKMKDQIINIKKGEFGNYIQIVKGSNKRNVSIPAKVNIETITIEKILEIIMNKKPINKKYKSY